MIFFKYGNKFDKRRKFRNNLQNLTTCTHKNTSCLTIDQKEQDVKGSYTWCYWNCPFICILYQEFTPIKRFLWEKHTNWENYTFYIKITPPKKKHLEILKENTTCSLEPMIERLAIKDNRCSINYQSDLPYILKNWFNATNWDI